MGTVNTNECSLGKKKIQNTTAKPPKNKRKAKKIHRLIKETAQEE